MQHSKKIKTKKKARSSALEGATPKRPRLVLVADRPVIHAKLVQALMQSMPLPKSPKMQLAEDLESLAKILRKENIAQPKKRRGRPRKNSNVALLLKIIDRWRADAGHRISDSNAAERLARSHAKSIGGAPPEDIRAWAKTLKNQISRARTKIASQ